MLLQGKIALVQAAGGQVGSRVAEQLVRDGAHVWLAARDKTRLTPLAESLRRAGGTVEVIAIDALDSGSIEDGTRSVVRTAGRLDIEAVDFTLDEVIHSVTVVTAQKGDMPLRRTTSRTAFLTDRRFQALAHRP